jgi:hypothetical protein
VRIFAKKNDALYEGAISNGVASGLGTLYDKNGNLLYRGAFANNTFHGDGTLYFSNGQVKYNGKFSKNIFNGNGALSFPSGRVEYIGAFLNGKKHGKGSLFTETGAKIYEGMFYNDNPDLSAYLNVDVVSLKDVFLGSKVIYNCENKMCISYPDLNCMIVADRDENTLGKTQKIFIIPPNYYPGTNSESNRFNLMAILDDNFVNGFTKLTPTEMCVIDVMRKHGSNRFKNYDFISKEEALKDVFDVTTQSSDYEIYVSKYKIHSFVYTFYFEASDTPYAFYSIERVG